MAVQKLSPKNLLYVATPAKKPVSNEVLVKHDNITDIATYQRMNERVFEGKAYSVPQKRRDAMLLAGSVKL